MPIKPVVACYSVSCMDPRERVVEARFLKTMHLLDAIDAGKLNKSLAKKIVEVRKEYGTPGVTLAVNLYRNARAGGGWSLDARGDLQTIKDNGLPVAAIYSTRHRQCAAVKVNRHLHDQDVAVMIVEDFHAVGIDLPPVFRAHLEVVSKHEEFDQKPMNIKSLVAYAMVRGVSRNFPQDIYSVTNAADILGIDSLTKSELNTLAADINLTAKGLLTPDIELDEIAGH